MGGSFANPKTKSRVFISQSQHHRHPERFVVSRVPQVIAFEDGSIRAGVPALADIADIKAAGQLTRSYTDELSVPLWCQVVDVQVYDPGAVAKDAGPVALRMPFSYSMYVASGDMLTSVL